MSGTMNDEELPRYNPSGGAPRHQLPVRASTGYPDSPLHNSTSFSTPHHAKEETHRAASLAVGLASVFAENVLSHPFVVLRRQCQVHPTADSWYHLTPFTLVQPMFNIQRHQGITSLWKGIGSTFLVKGIGVATETAISEISPLPKISIAITAPFYAASLVETVQSDIASERPGVFDCLTSGAERMFGWTTHPTNRLLSIWSLLPAAVLHGVCHYAILSIAKYTVLSSVRAEQQDNEPSLSRTAERTVYEQYFPELLAGFSGALLADGLLYPLETVLHRLCAQGTRAIIDNVDTGTGVIPIITRYDGFLDCVRGIVTDEGFAGLYKGFGALVLQYAIHAALLRGTKLIFELLLAGKMNHVIPSGGQEFTPSSMTSYAPGGTLSAESSMGASPSLSPIRRPASSYSRLPQPQLSPHRSRATAGGEPLPNF